MMLLAAILGTCLLWACGGGGSGGNGNGDGSGSVSFDSTHGTSNCPAGNALFSFTPLPLASVTGWEPLGHMGPPAHTFPTDHQYLYFINPNAGNTSPPLPVIAPSDMRVWLVYGAGSGKPDYSVFFQVCAQVMGRFGHLASLSADLLAAAGPIDQSCQTYEPAPGSPVTLCQSKIMQFDVKAGQVIGSVGNGASLALDWWLWDSRVADIHFTSPSRFTPLGGSGPFTEARIVPASAYYTADLTAQINAKLGRFDGSQLRSAAPLGGSIEVDVDGTARGYWFNPAQAYPPESYHAALAPDYVNPNITQVFSLGVSQANPDSTNPAPVAFYGSFAPVSTGLVNRAFESVTADGRIYCYETVAQNRVLLLQLLDAGTLKLEALAATLASCAAAQPWAFSAKAVSYKR